MLKAGVILVTTGSRQEALDLAHTLVTERLAVCVNLLPVTSIYRWQGELCQEDEWQLLLKARLDDFEQLEQRIQALHSYSIPEVLGLSVAAGSPAYLAWMAEETAE